MCVCVCVCVRVCVCVCVRARARAQARHGKVSEGKSKYILSFSMSLSLRENLSTSFFFSLSLNDFFPLECLSCTMTRTQTHTQTLPYYRMCSLTIECVLSFSMSLQGLEFRVWGVGLGLGTHTVQRSKPAIIRPLLHIVREHIL